MEDLQSRFNTYLAGNPGLQAQIAGSGATLKQAQEYANTLSACITSGLASAALPFEVGFTVSAPSVDGTQIKIEANLDPVERPSWGSGGPARLVELFNHGWHISSPTLPFGPWGNTGKMGRALRDRGGKRFIQQIASDFAAQVPSNVSITYDSKYD